MRAQDCCRPYPAGIWYFYHLLVEDFPTWRCRFERLADKYRWTDAVTIQFAFAYMRDTATQAVMDIPLYGSEIAEQLLDVYQDRFRIGEDLRLLLAQRRVSRICRRRYRRNRRRSLLRPRAKRGIRPPVCSCPVARRQVDNAAVCIPIAGSQDTGVVPPLDAEDAKEGNLVID